MSKWQSSCLIYRRMLISGANIRNHKFLIWSLLPPFTVCKILHRTPTKKTTNFREYNMVNIATISCSVLTERFFTCLLQTASFNLATWSKSWSQEYLNSWNYQKLDWLNVVVKIEQSGKLHIFNFLKLMQQ